MRWFHNVCQKPLHYNFAINLFHVAYLLLLVRICYPMVTTLCIDFALAEIVALKYFDNESITSGFYCMAGFFK